MKVSLITATYNSEKYISSCLKSVREQDFEDIEHLIIDGASDDKTLEIVREESPESVLVSEKDDGIYDALNKGIRKASGDIVGILHSDDYFESENTICQIAEAFHDPEVVGVYSDLEYVKADGSVLRYWKSGVYSSRLLRKGWMPPHPTLFLRRKVFDKLAPYNVTYKIAADYDFILRLFNSELGKFSYIPAPLVKMRVGGVSNNSLRNIKIKSSEDLRSLRSNNIPFPLMVLLRKNLSKITQFF